MRKVKVKKYIPKQWKRDDNGPGQVIIEGTGVNIEYTGLFHEWGVNYEEGENGFGNYTVGIIELDNGKIELIVPEKIQFLNNFV